MVILLLYCLALLIIAGAIIYIWLSRQKPEEKMEKAMEKSKDNL